MTIHDRYTVPTVLELDALSDIEIAEKLRIAELRCLVVIDRLESDQTALDADQGNDFAEYPAEKREQDHERLAEDHREEYQALLNVRERLLGYKRPVWRNVDGTDKPLKDYRVIVLELLHDDRIVLATSEDHALKIAEEMANDGGFEMDCTLERTVAVSNDSVPCSISIGGDVPSKSLYV